MIEPAEGLDADTTAHVTLAGKDWPIPLLVWRDLRKCRKELLELQALLNETIAAAPLDPDAGVEAHGVRNMEALSSVFQGLSNADYDRLVMGPLLAGLNAAHPALTLAEFESWPKVSEFDRQLAWLTVRRQSGLFVAREEAPDTADEASEEAPSSGESQGAP